ncbi:MAG: leucine-rich repeat domain-containing protein [Clostridia bacterium]|nr:leucine-rich repeat domain-containing protein [Clostridia bacterium]
MESFCGGIAIKRTLFVILALAALCCGPALADTTGSFGGLSWSLTSEGALTISGTGAMADYTAITFPWYEHRASIVKASIGSGVTRIGDAAFAHCKALSDVTLPDTLTAIGQNAFVGCSALEALYIPDGVTSIGSKAFAYCTGLTQIRIPASVTVIPVDLFQGITKSQLTIFGAPGSAAEAFALSARISFEVE